jgi:hypothetical protein
VVLNSYEVLSRRCETGTNADFYHKGVISFYWKETLEVNVVKISRV